MTSEISTMKGALGEVAVRSLPYVVPAVYLATTEWSIGQRSIQVMAVAYGPTLIVYGAGASEAVVRSIVNLLGSVFAAKPKADRRRVIAAIEFDTAHRMVRNALFPVSGWIALAMDIHCFLAPRHDKFQRDVIADYYVGRAPYIVGQTTYRVGKGLCVHVVKPVADVAWEVTWKTTKFTFEILDTVGFFKTVEFVATWSAVVIATGLGFAVDVIRGGNR